MIWLINLIQKKKRLKKIKEESERIHNESISQFIEKKLGIKIGPSKKGPLE